MSNEKHIDAPPPEGALYTMYNPMSPATWDLVPANVHTFVYCDVTTAMKALNFHVDRLLANAEKKGWLRVSSGAPRVFYRGQKEITNWLLPTRLRVPGASPSPRMRYGYSVDPQYREQARKERGEWVEEEPGMRDFTELVDRLTPEELDRRDLTEQKALQRSQAVPEIAKLDAFRRRAAVRHYAEPPSPLLDVTSDIEVAAFFATGSGQPVKEGYGLISAISLEFVAQLFQLDPIRVQGGWTVVGRPRLHEWGDNVKMLRDQKLEVTQLEITAVDLPFRRPQAQKALFLTLDGPAEGRIDTRSELLWWSMLERWSWSVGFIQNAECYRNESKEITAEHLLPQDIQI